MRDIYEIIAHCTATRADWWSSRSTSAKVNEVKRWHVSDRGFKDIGYHFLIDRNGVTVAGRPIEKVGAHTQGRNTGTIGVALFGGHGSAATDRFRDHFTSQQDMALRILITALRAKYGALALSGHNQWAAKACPGFNVPNWHAQKET